MFAELRSLKAGLLLDSRTSSQPPSQDKPWAPRSERLKTNRSSGGQPKHPGKTLKMVDQPDDIVTLPVGGVCTCGQALGEVAVHDLLARQVHELPEFRVQVTEYRAEVKVCPHCTQRVQAPFPAQVTGQVQYGPRLHGLAAYLNVVHFVPLKRTTEVLEALCGARLSDGTVALNLHRAAGQLSEFGARLDTALRQQPVLYADETGSRVNGKLAWLHVVSCGQLTRYGHHPSRGYAAVQTMNILTQYQGLLMHDALPLLGQNGTYRACPLYAKLPAKHALCNAHLLRELRGLDEHYQQVWAGTLRTALQTVYHHDKHGTLTPTMQNDFEAEYDALVQTGLDLNPLAVPLPNRRGRTKQLPGRNLAQRCQQQRNAVLRFLIQPGAPFDNNQAERDIRPWCSKRKISGGFRSEDGAHGFALIRSYVSTLRKQGLNVWQGLVSIFRGDVIMPDFSC